MNLSILVLLLLLIEAAQAQTYQQVAPHALPGNSNASGTQTPPPPEPVGDEATQIESLKGVVFVGSNSEIVSKGLPEASGVVLKNLPLLDNSEFREIVQGYLERPLSLKGLNALMREVVLAYRSQNHPVVFVTAPEQEIASGVVQILVLEGKVGEIRVDHSHWYSPEYRKSIRLRPSNPILADRLNADIDWINDNPFHQVNAVLSPGKEPGLTDIELRVQERFPLRVFTGYEDSGNDTTGDERWFAGFNLGNVFGLDQQLNYQFIGSSDLNMLTAHAGSYLIPLAWRHRLLFLGSYARAVGDLQNGNQSGGISWQVGTRYQVPLPTLFDGRFHHESALGLDFKQSDNNLAIGGVTSNTPYDVTNLSLDYTCSFKDDWGVTNFEPTLTYNPGGITRQDSNAYYDAVRQGARSQFFYAKFDLSRNQHLPYDFSYVVHGLAQIANGNLVSSEQLGLGGYNTIRGYEEREANGDSGWMISQELRTPPISLGQMVGIMQAHDQLQFLGFWDYGVTHNQEPLTGEIPYVVLSSIGPGVRYTIAPYLSVRFDFGWQLTDTGVSDGRRSERAHLGVVMSY